MNRGPYRVHRAARTGVRRWRVLSADGQHVRGLDTKIEATMTCEVLNGDVTRAPELYRRWHRRGGAGAAMLSARLLGLLPGHVRADPDTGEPL